jgi:hypothetical protein
MVTEQGKYSVKGRAEALQNALDSNELEVDCVDAAFGAYEINMSPAMKNFTFRVPQETYDWLLEAVKLTGRTRSSKSEKLGKGAWRNGQSLKTAKSSIRSRDPMREALGSD